MASSGAINNHPSPVRIARSKSGADLLFDKMKQDKLQHDEQAAVDFLNEMLDDHASITCGNLHDELKDGVLLCNLVNKLRPGTIRHVGQRDLSFIKMDNITRFLQGARQLGLNDAQLFETIDLFEAKDMPAVIHTILVIAQMHYKSVDRKKEPKAPKEHVPAGEKEDAQAAIKEIQDAPITIVDDDDDNDDDGSDHESTTGYRDVRDIFANAYEDDPFVRPPKSPLRATPNKSNPSRRSHHHHPQRRKSAEELLTRRPSAPVFSSQGRSNQTSTRDFTSSTAMSRTSSASSCQSFLSSTSSTSSETPPVTPQSTTGRSRRKSEMMLHHQHQHPEPRDQSEKDLDHRQLLKAAVEIDKQDKGSTTTSKSREKISLKSKDGLTRTQYQLGNCIGKGQFGSVYRALDLSTGETVAVKRIRLDDADIDQEIMKEVSLLKTLSHSNVIQYLGFIKSRNHINIALEYAENGSLMSTLKAFGAFPEKLVASFCIKILNGLEYLHANQVVHCDLKAANILTTKTGDVKLSDFGVSLNLKIKGADAGTVSGTPNWMAPEVIELKGASPKCDIWSLGCTLVELITGKPPYADLIAMSAMFRIVEDNYPPLPDKISDEMHSFLLCCFQKNPDDRPTATQLKEHLWLRTHQRRMKKSSTLTSYLEHKQRSKPQQKPNHERQHHHRCRSSSKSKRSSNVTTATSSSVEYCHPLDQQQRPVRCEAASPKRFDTETSFDNESGMSFSVDEDYITHRFIQTSFGKVVECKVCGDLMKSRAIFCEVCALICHEECKKLAFSCPPKVKDQQPSYDWVFSAKIYNRSPQDRTSQDTSARSASAPAINWNRQDIFGMSLENHPQMENIRKYSLALGLTQQEQRALSENQALLSHAQALHHMNPEAVEKLLKRKAKDRKKSLGAAVSGGSTEDCTIS